MHDDEALFRTVHGIAGQMAGQPVPAVIDALVRRLPQSSGLTGDDLRRIAEEISVGRDPSGL